MSLKKWLSPATRSTSAKRITKKKPRKPEPSLRLEHLEDRTVPAFFAAAGSPFTAGDSPSFLTGGFLNGGVRPDIIVPNQIGNSLSVFQPNASGALTTRNDTGLQAVGGPLASAVGFFNADANLDVVAANFNTSTIQILTGNGAAAGDFATVGAPISYTGGAGPAGVAVGQLNSVAGDDIVVSNFNNGTLTILLNDGTGVFASQTVITLGQNNPEFIALGNFDKSADGSLDIAVANVGSNSVTFLFNFNNSGNFTTIAPVTIAAVGTLPRGIAAADLDQDGDLDVVVANSSSGNIRVISNDTVTPGTPVLALGGTFATGPNPFGLAVADFNADGDLDVVTTRDNASGFADVLLGGAGQTFGAATPVPVGGTNGVGVIALSVDGDAAPDFVVASSLSDTVSVMLNSDAIINGTVAGDTILVERVGANTQVTVNGVVTYSQPVANVTSLKINGLTGSDTLTVDYAGGNPIPSGGITFNGGFNAGDTLNIRNGNWTTNTYNYINSNNGSVDLDGSIINYTGLAPIVNSGTAANAIFNLPSGNGDDMAEIIGNGIAFDNISRLRSLAAIPTFEQTDFASPTASLTINLGNDGESYVHNTATDLTTPSIIVNGGTAADTISIRRLNAVNTTNINAGGGADIINVGAPANSLDSITSLLTVNGGGDAGDTLNLNDQGDATANTYGITSTQVTRTGIPAITYSGLSNLNLNGGTGGNIFNIQSTAAGATTNVDGGAGVNTYNVSSDAPTNTGDLNSLDGLLNIANNTGSVLNISESGLATADTVTVNTNGGGAISGTAGGGWTITSSGTTFAAINLFLGSAADIIAVQSTNPNEPVTINANDGNDVFTITGSGLGTGAGNNVFNGGNGDDTFNMNGYAAAGADVTISGGAHVLGDSLIFDALNTPVIFTNTTLSNGTGSVVNYDTIENLTINNAAPLTVNGDATANTLILTSLTDTTATFQLDGGPIVAIGNSPFTFNGLGNNDTMQVINFGTVYTPAITYNGGLGNADRLHLTGNIGAAGAGIYNTGPGAANEFSGDVRHTTGAFAQIVTFTGLAPVEDLTVQGSMTINDNVVGGSINLIQGPVSVQNDPLTGVPEPTYEINFAGAAELFRFRNRTNVIINGDAGGNTVIVNVPNLLDGTGTNPLSVNPLTTLLVNTGLGTDTVGVRATPAGVITTVDGNAAVFPNPDNVVVGSLAPTATGGVLTAISGELRIQNTILASALTIDASGDAVARNATLDTTVIGATTFGRLTGLGNTGAIEYAIAPGIIGTVDFTSVTINGGSGGNTFLVNQTPAVIGLIGPMPTTINTGTGVDNVNIQATSSGISYLIQGQNGDDNVTVGSNAPAVLGNLNAINGTVQIDNTLGKTLVTIDASGDAAAHIALIDTTNNSFNGNTPVVGNVYGRVTGLGNPAQIIYRTNTRQVRGVIVNTGTGGDILTINQPLAAESPYLTTVNSGGGGDNFIVQAIAFANNYQLNGQGGNDTFTIVNAPVAGVSLDINGSAGGQVDLDTLIAPDINNTWSITGTDAGSITNVVTSFQSIENLTGGTAADNFVFNPAGAITGTVDGRGTNDILDFSAQAGVGIGLTLAGITDGFNGVTSGVIGNSFLNINTIIGSTVGAADILIGTGLNSNWVLTGTGAGTYTEVASGKVLTFSKFENLVGDNVTDTLTGPNTVNTWNITGANAGTVAGTAFFGMANLNGGSLADTFVFAAGSSITGILDGRGLADAINFAALTSQAVVLTAVGGTDGFNGSATPAIGGGFLNINAITGSAAGLTDSLTGLNTNSIWTVTAGSSTYQDLGSGRVFTFTNFETLTGGAGSDQFTLVAPVPTVTLNGGVGIDTLTGASIVNLWNITAAGGGTVGPATFAAFENFVGGALADTFRFGVAGSVPGSVNGGAGENWLDYSLRANGITVNFTTGIASLIAGGVSNVRNAFGSIAGGDTLTAGPTGGVLVGKGANNTLRGSGGASILIGGSGVNRIFTGTGGDIAIAGSTSFDASTPANTLALASMLAEWQSGNSYQTRINNLKNGGGLNGANTLVQGGTVNSPTAPAIGPKFGYGGNTNQTTITVAAGGLQNWFFTNSPQAIVVRRPNEQIN